MDSSTIAALGIIATVIVAIATLVVAFQTKRLAKATNKLGTEAERQVTEMETSRKLEWNPYLTFQPTEGGDHLVGDYVHYNAIVTNIGRGPAINCVLVRFMLGKWCQSNLFDLGYGQQEKVTANAQATARPTFAGPRPGFTTTLFCQDQFGACHMFEPPNPAQAGSPAEGAPAWVDWYRQQITR